MVKDIIKYGLGAAIAGMICCVAPMILFAFGLAGGIYAISFADFFYNEDGGANIYGWILRGLGAVIVAYGIYRYNKKQSCSLNSPKQKLLNKILFAVILIVFALAMFFFLEKTSGDYFNEKIVPQQQLEYQNQ